MQKFTHPSAIAGRPNRQTFTADDNAVVGYLREGDPATLTPPSNVTADLLNDLIDEIYGITQIAGDLPLDPANNGQAKIAIQNYVTQRVTDIVNKARPRNQSLRPLAALTDRGLTLERDQSNDRGPGTYNLNTVDYSATVQMPAIGGFYSNPGYQASYIIVKSAAANTVTINFHANETLNGVAMANSGTAAITLTDLGEGIELWPDPTSATGGNWYARRFNNTPATGDNSKKIATTEYVRNFTTDYTKNFASTDYVKNYTTDYTKNFTTADNVRKMLGDGAAFNWANNRYIDKSGYIIFPGPWPSLMMKWGSFTASLNAAYAGGSIAFPSAFPYGAFAGCLTTGNNNFLEGSEIHPAFGSAPRASGFDYVLTRIYGSNTGPETLLVYYFVIGY